MHRRLNGVFSHQVGFPATKDLEQFASIAEVLRDRPPVTLRLERPGRPVGMPEPAVGTDSSCVVATSSGHSWPTAAQ